MIYLQGESNHGKDLKEEYAAAFKTKGTRDSAESLFMALIFQQQKMLKLAEPNILHFFFLMLLMK
jgi:hypothetical protein